MATESFFSNASLAYLASAGAGKDGKTYSIKPTDGSGDFTFSRGSNLAATRVGPTGLIEKGRENLLLQSNNFDTTWGNYGITQTSGQSGYDGSSDAWESSFTAGTKFFGQTISQIGVITISIYVKAGNHDFIQFVTSTSTTAYVNFDISSSSAAVGTEGSGVINSSITSVGSDWYRCSMSFNNTSSGTIYVWMIDSATSSRASDVSTAGNILIQDAQLEIGLAATEVITSGATKGKAGLLEDEPRFDYSGGATCPSLLLEPSRTNLASSEYFQQFWSPSSGGTRIYNQITSPEGVQNGTKIYPTSTGSFRGLSKAFGSTLSNTPYAVSIFAKAGEFEHLYFYNIGSPNGNNGVWFNLTTGNVGATQSAWTSAKMEDFGNGWYRCSAVITPGGSADNIYILLADSNGSVTATTNGTDGLYIYGAQVEQGSYPTSYIPNHSGGSVTRESDGLDLNPLDQSYGSESTWFFEAERLPSDDLLNQTLGIFTNSGAVGAVNRFVVNSTSNGRLRVSVYDENGISENLFSNTDVFVKGQTTKFALKIAAGNIALFVNGNDPITETGLGVITGIDRVVTIEDTILKQFLVFPEALSNEDCKNLTTL